MLEPGTAHPLQRLRAVRELVDAGINAGVLMAPDRSRLLLLARRSSSAPSKRSPTTAPASSAATSCTCRTAPARTFMDFIEREFPVDAAAVRAAVREEIPAGRLSEGGARHGAGAAASLRPDQTRGSARDQAGSAWQDRRRRHAGRIRWPDGAKDAPKASRPAAAGLQRAPDDVSARARNRRCTATSPLQSLPSCSVDSTRSRSPSARDLEVRSPSFHRALIGSLICSSMTRFRNRAPNARL